MTFLVHCATAAIAAAACARPAPLTQVGDRVQSNPPAPGECRVPSVHVMVVNKGADRLQVSWKSLSTPPIELRIGEAGLGTSYLRLADYAREQIFGKRGYFDVRHASQRMVDWGTNQTRRPVDYGLQLVCSENIDPSKR